MKRKIYMNEQATVSAVVGRVNANGKYVEVYIDDIEVGKLPDDIQEALDTDYDIAIRLDSCGICKGHVYVDRLFGGQSDTELPAVLFKELSAYPPDVMWYYSNLPVTSR